MFMYSAPLVWQDKHFQLRPIDTLNFDIERQNLRQCLLNSRRDIKLVCVNATTERLRDEVTRGCTCLHYSGHGSPSHLSFRTDVVDFTPLMTSDCDPCVLRVAFKNFSSFSSLRYSQRAGRLCGCWCSTCVLCRCGRTTFGQSGHIYACFLLGSSMETPFEELKSYSAGYSRTYIRKRATSFCYYLKMQTMTLFCSRECRDSRVEEEDAIRH